MHCSFYHESSSNKNTEHNFDSISSQFAKGPHHWYNIPSGAEYQSNLEKNYPGMRSGPCNSEYDRSFPYQRLRPIPQKPQSDLLLYSNTKTYSQTNAPKNGNSSLYYQKAPRNTSRGNHDEDRIRKALKHIDSASKILENY